MKYLRIALVVLVIAGLVNYFRPLPAPRPIQQIQAPPASKPLSIKWPDSKQAAIGALDYGLFDAKPTDESFPIASLAKVFTALVVLKDIPLSGSNGPSIKLSQKDVDVYKRYLAKNGSVALVAKGEKLTERQVLQGMLIPSANNLADSLAVWAFGSVENYVIKASQYAKQLGLSGTVIADASGFSPKTVSTARDQVMIGLLAAGNKDLASIFSKKSVILPVAGKVNNTNWLLGRSGINGIKTGHTDQAGGAFLFSATQTVGLQPMTFVGAIIGAKDSYSAIKAATPLLADTIIKTEVVMIAKAHQEIGHYRTAWGQSIPVLTQSELQINRWRGQPASLKAEFLTVGAGDSAGKVVGILKAAANQKAAETKLILKDKIEPPSFFWRLIRL